MFPWYLCRRIILLIYLMVTKFLIIWFKGTHYNASLDKQLVIQHHLKMFKYYLMVNIVIIVQILSNRFGYIKSWGVAQSFQFNTSLAQYALTVVRKKLSNNSLCQFPANSLIKISFVYSVTNVNIEIVAYSSSFLHICTEKRTPPFLLVFPKRNNFKAVIVFALS